MVQVSKEELEDLKRLEAVARSYIDARREELPAHIVDLFDRLELPEQLAWIRDYPAHVRRRAAAQKARELQVRPEEQGLAE
jgi:hypothetical protein